MKTQIRLGITGTIAVTLWLTLFLAGILVDSQPFREQFAKGIQAGHIYISDFAIALFTYTVTNIAVLACLAGIIGTELRLFTVLNSDGSSNMQQVSPKWIHSITHGLMHGFLIYILFLAGAYVISTSPFGALSPEKYSKLAGILSMGSFLVSFEPKFVKTLIATLRSESPLAG